MTTLREGLVPPRHELAAADAEALRRYLDGRRRVRLACWVGHDHGATCDDHLLLGIDDADRRSGDLRALDLGLEHDLPSVEVTRAIRAAGVAGDFSVTADHVR